METNPIKKLRRYPGTRPFNEDEAKLFFGRGEDINNLYDLVCTQSMVVVCGRTGLGKSSLLHAGLTPRFRSKPNIYPLFIRFGTYFDDSDQTPVQRLISDIKENTTANTFLSEKLNAEEQAWNNNLWYLIKNKQISDPQKDTFVLIFDQFEEIFSYPEEEITAFKKQLSELLFVKIPQEIRNSVKEKSQKNKDLFTKEETNLLYTPLNVKILLAIRSDRLSMLNSMKDFFPSVLQTCYELNPLNTEQATQAIERPARLEDAEIISPPFSFEKAAIDLIISSLRSGKKNRQATMSKDEIEPFQLQIVCRFAEDLGIEKGDTDISAKDLGNIKEIFENNYRNLVKRLPEKYRLPARKLIEEKLIIDGTRVTMPVPFIMRDPGMSRELLNLLIETRIVRPEQNNTIEISHDTLVEPILKYYDERKQQEALDLELKEKDLQISRIKEQQAREFKSLQAKQRFRMKAVLAATIVLFVVFPLLYSNYHKHKILEQDRSLQKIRSKAYGYLAKARRKLVNDPTKALLYADSALQTILRSDSNSYATIRSADSEIMSANYFYTDIVKTKPGSVIAISDDGTQIITTNDSGLIRLSGIDGRVIKTLKQKGLLRSAGFSATGAEILLGYFDGSLYKWNVKTDSIKEYPNQGSSVTTSIFSANQQQILVCTGTGKINIMDSSGVDQFSLPGGKYTCAIFSRDGSKILTGDINGRVTLWSNNGDEEDWYQNWDMPITSLAFTELGYRFICGSQTGFANLWEVADDIRPLVTIGDGDSISISGLCIDSINNATKYLRICTGDDSGNLELVELRHITRKPANNSEPGDKLESIYWYNSAYDLAGLKKKILCVKKVKENTLISGSADGTVKLWYKINAPDIPAALNKLNK